MLLNCLAPKEALLHRLAWVSRASQGQVRLAFRDADARYVWGRLQCLALQLQEPELPRPRADWAACSHPAASPGQTDLFGLPSTGC